jgi:hypothetical protein
MRSGHAANASLTASSISSTNTGIVRPRRGTPAPGGREAFLDRRVLGDEHVVVEIRLQLPLIGRVCLRDVDEDHGHPLAEPFVQRLDVARPATEGWSGEAAEDENERSIHNECIDADGLADLDAPRPHIALHRREHDVAFLGVEPRDVSAIAGVEPLSDLLQVACTHARGVWR